MAQQKANMSLRVPLKVKRWYERQAKKLDVTASKLASLPVIKEYEAHNGESNG